MAAGHWIGDGSPEIVINSDKPEVECVLEEGSSSGGNVYNAIWKESDEEISSGSHYWKIHVFDLNPNSIFVGLTNTEKIEKGWGLKGLLYGGPGNLSNGSALVTSNYGPKIKSGDTVGVLAVFESGNLKVYFELNGEPRGLAFDLPETVLPGILPCVHFSGAGKATIVKSNEIPTDLIKKEPVYDGIEGDWECLEFGDQKPNVSVGIFKDEEEPQVFRVGVHVINRIHYSLRRNTETHKWEISGGMSTRMGGPPERMQLEYQVKQFFENLSQVEVDAENTLVISNNSGITSKWKRYSTSQSTCAVTTTPF